jgi:hypothetical protein
VDGRSYPAHLCRCHYCYRHRAAQKCQHRQLGHTYIESLTLSTFSTEGLFHRFTRASLETLQWFEIITALCKERLIWPESKSIIDLASLLASIPFTRGSTTSQFIHSIFSIPFLRSFTNSLIAFPYDYIY